MTDSLKEIFLTTCGHPLMAYGQKGAHCTVRLDKQ